MALQQFKQEVGNNFDEHHLKNILFEFYKEKKYYYESRYKLYIQGLEPVKEWEVISLSKNGKFLCEENKNSIKIYVLTTIGSFEKHLYLTITGIEEMNSIKMYDNVVYYISNESLSIIDIKNLTLSTISLENGIGNNYYVYKGILCMIEIGRVIIYNVDGTRCIVPTQYGRLTFENGILCICNSKLIHIINIEHKTCQILDNINNYSSVYSTEYGYVSTSNNKELLILPLGKIINVRDVSKSNETYQYFGCDMSMNNNVLMCHILLNHCIGMLIFIDLNNETVINIILADGNILHSGFLEPQIVTETIKPMMIDYSELKMI
jgi:hypothetical protein